MAAQSQAEIKCNDDLAKTTLKLHDGNSIPQVALGTYLKSRAMKSFRSSNIKMSEEQIAKDKKEDEKEEKEFGNAIKVAIQAGYRHIDTAQVYRTEVVIGNALQELYKDNIIKREELFLTTKIARNVRDPKEIRESIENSLKYLQTDYIDLMLIHSPHSQNRNGLKGHDVIELYKILHEYREKGKIKSVGVSNFGLKHLEILEKSVPDLPIPVVNQIECHPFLQETEIIEYCQKKNILMESYSPIAQAVETVRNDQLLNKLAKKYNKTFSHIMLRWQIQRGFVLLPKSVTPKRIISNGDLFSFQLTEDEMKELNGLKEEELRICWNPLNVPWDDNYGTEEAEKIKNSDPVNEALKTTKIKLNDGIEIPQLGLGTFSYKHVFRFENAPEDKTERKEPTEEEKEKLKQDDEKEKQQFKDAVIYATKIGYRHIDAAEIYRTQDVIGEALQELYKDGIVKREEIFITSKVAGEVRTAEAVSQSVDQSLKDLQTDYIDLYLIHSPHSSLTEDSGKRGQDVLDVYKQLHELKKQGKIKSVGVSNFNVTHLKSIEKAGLPLPSVNQIELHCFLVEQEIIDYCKSKNIMMEAYCPIARGNEKARNNEYLNQLGGKAGGKRNWAHIMIRWCIQKGFIVLPKSVTPERILANGDVFEFAIEEHEMKTLEELQKEKLRVSWNPLTVVWDV
eukprot:CAMPEP_0201575570 /NCGR_PEP_ID=MMETSP0190_2-20130828/20857_1 /ASSEMBLY_ACC=CAM_ASM_000263 /TAXON_ID=37353 /ORGANISM="Rosalina sp." /LENGTH=678 /DNA_ID=CAMNT_0048005375 /DNA_START=26 /DNA_END=2062 /DNA_ORIENTATION=-